MAKPDQVFKVVSPFGPAGDQPKAIEALADGVTADTIVSRVVSLVPAPRLEMAMEPTA